MVGAGGGGGYHWDGAGGFSGGGAEGNPTSGVNGQGGGKQDDLTLLASGGGGYYTKGKGYEASLLGTAAVGGQAGSYCQVHGPTVWYKDVAGDGGQAGKGGNIYYVNVDNIFAYNGSMITNDDYNTTYYEYNKDGTLTSNILKVIFKPNGEKTIPAKIFAQSGIIRETYTTNQGAFTLSKVKTGEALPEIANSGDKICSVKATEETTALSTGYNKGYMENQGIGSGAGYLESENGTFQKIQ